MNTDNVIVKNNNENGLGVFAVKDFEKDEEILYIDGETTEAESLDSFPKEIQEHLYPFDKVGKLIKYVIPFPEAPWQFLNHSCNPNAGIVNNRTIVAIKKINKGEEVVFDYAMNNIDNYKMECSCGLNLTYQN